MNILKLNSTARDEAAHNERPTAFGPNVPCVRSEDLIGKDREIMIEHSGAFYRLRITRANKLILTK